jgi:hypothetical protein
MLPTGMTGGLLLAPVIGALVLAVADFAKHVSDTSDHRLSRKYS